ncbi:MAG TPA: hypothetical protein VL728_07470 [Cyclobacteriaceae bacterium]|jgi:hypothetical protein|nr:hypothetical protein [Cyclobacteriaceae bacterium]
MTLNTILKELKDFPADRLDELHQFIQSLIPTSKQREGDRKKILSYGGSFGGMSKKDYTAFVRHTKKSRAKLFDRATKL